MFGLEIKITALLLLNIPLIQGNSDQKNDYLMDDADVDHYDDFGVGDGSVPESDVISISDVIPKPVKNIRDFNFKKNASRRPYPIKKIYGIGNSGACQNFQGLPRPESGCCGVQMTISRPCRHFYMSESTSASQEETTVEKKRRKKLNRLMGRFPGKSSPQQGNSHSRSPDYSNKRIRGGKATNFYQFPWMARLSINTENANFGFPKSCGGTIISSRYVLTAAHCLHGTYKNIKQLDVFLAEYDSSTYPKDCIGKHCIKNLVITADQVIIHPKFNKTYLINDMALVKLSLDIPYTDFIRPICLPTADIEELSKERESFIIAGWGLDGRLESNVKQAAAVNYVSNENCKAQYPYKDDGMFCSIGGHGEDICHGDSGGPLMVYHMDKYFLSGVVNGKRRDHECGSSVPSLFHNVFYHVEWINKHVK